MRKLKSIFLDRDGVINFDKGYVHKKEEFEFIPEIFDLLKYFKDREFTLFIITNQSGIGRGYYSLEDFHKLNTWMLREFEKFDIHIERVEFCPHKPTDECVCRKPQTGMLDRIMKDYDVDLENSWMIGDKESDINFAKNGKIQKTIYVDIKNKGMTRTRPDFIVTSIGDIKNII